MATIEAIDNVINGIAYRPFSETDWYGWAGAEMFNDGTQPRIADCRVSTPKGDMDAVIIADATGVTIHAIDEDGCAAYAWYGPEANQLPFPFVLALLRGVLTLVQDGHLTYTQLGMMFARIA